MKSGAPWHINGVQRETVDHAREAARRAGMSVGQWLNTVVRESPALAPADSEDDVYDDPYAPPALRRAQQPQADFSAITQRLEGLTGEVERLTQAAKASREDAQHDATAQRLSDAIARLDERVESFMTEGRNATQALGEKVESVDRALAALGRERQRAVSCDWATASVDSVVDEIEQRQRELEREGFAPSSVRANGAQASGGFIALHEQLNRVSEKIGAFDTGAMGAAIDSLRNDLADIAGKLTEASPRRAIEALEGEVRVLAARLDDSRSNGSAAPDLSHIESGIAEIRNAIRALTPAENLSGAVDAIHVLSHKIDQMAAGGQDPASMQQLETAISGLRGIVSRVASDDSLAALTNEVRALSDKIISGLSGVASGNNLLQTLEQRIGTIADAIESVRKSAAESGTSALEAAVRSLGDKIDRLPNASDQTAIGADLGALIGSLGERIDRMQAASDPSAGNAQFGAMLGSLGDKIESLSASRDSDVLRQIEERITALFIKLEASESRLGNLDSIDRGMKELLAYLETVRGSSPPLQPDARPVQNIVRDVQKTQESLEAAHGTIGDVVDRLAMIETGIRSGAKPATEPVAPTITAAVPANPKWTTSARKAEMMPAPASALPPSTPQMPKPAEEPQPQATSAIGDLLPHDHPLEPGSGKPRPGLAAAMPISPPLVPQATPAERIAISKALADPPGGEAEEIDAKQNFIVAARRAAKAAVQDDSVLTPRPATPEAAKASKKAKATEGPSNAAPLSGMRKHLKRLLVGASVIIIIAGAVHMVAGAFLTGDAPSEAPGRQSNLPAPVTTQSSGVIGEMPAGMNPNAGVLPQGPTVAPTVTPAVAPMPAAPAGSGSAPPAVAPAADVTGVVPGASSAAPRAPADLFAGLPVVRPAPLPSAIGSKALITAAENGDPAAAFEVATRFSDGRGVALNPEAAAMWFERAARGGLVPAVFRLGGIYEKGVGVKKDLTRARDLYTAAAERGNAKAMHNLAVLYAEGLDGKPDFAAALQWFRKAAARGVPDSQYNLGVLYARGIGVDQNFSDSFRWFALAAQSGDQDAAQKRDEVAKRLDAPALASVRAAVQSWTPEVQPDDAVTVKTPPGGWDGTGAPAASKNKSKRV
ncbi:MAG TPA: hypothetical protein VM867_07170 [Xanthobacteraceae bacterium]|nr:hypothetical protein [Xanthobacteraceae bacterium]